MDEQLKGMTDDDECETRRKENHDVTSSQKTFCQRRKAPKAQCFHIFKRYDASFKKYLDAFLTFDSVFDTDLLFRHISRRESYEER